jgi:hypothetical protein
MRRVIVRVQSLPVPEHLMQGDYAADAATREAFAVWVRQLWNDKDAQIARLLAEVPDQNGRAAER